MKMGLKFQLTWGVLHASAAFLAGLAAAGHIGSAAYHFRKARNGDY